MSAIIQLSEAVSIALHSVVFIATKKGEFVNVKMLQNQISSSANHIAKILQRLVHAGILKSIRGPAGGYILAKSAHEITLLDVYQATNGPVEIDSCPMGKNKCAFKSCIFNGELGKANQILVDYMKNTHLSAFF